MKSHVSIIVEVYNSVLWVMTLCSLEWNIHLLWNSQVNYCVHNTCDWHLSQAGWIESIYSHLYNLRSIYDISNHNCEGGIKRKIFAILCENISTILFYLTWQWRDIYALFLTIITSLYHCVMTNESLDSNISNTLCNEHLHLCWSDLIISAAFRAQRKYNKEEARKGP